ncbi:uncharacterized protein LMH87_007610 [Akanthomyces muscarius]|uniref:Uncharacterized protein n=1 Tax=Akanthomyces muscarius TaxID=2231603 RepID=A0A9W8QKH9_AKAMU|nr:uncharacterized protein LMH87_007610 [Akanthomyces muscarius]KAJ4161579.1 hypothetical protein LMH87_007610 [Akanthomyces muscarius]
MQAVLAQNRGAISQPRGILTFVNASGKRRAESPAKPGSAGWGAIPYWQGLISLIDSFSPTLIANNSYSRKHAKFQAASATTCLITPWSPRRDSGQKHRQVKQHVRLNMRLWHYLVIGAAATTTALPARNALLNAASMNSGADAQSAYEAEILAADRSRTLGIV